MREIKFRAWDKKRKRIYEVDNIDFRKKIINVFEPEDIRSYCTGNIECPFKSIILMQFTGLHDKNGKEAYYKDISIDEDGDKHSVEWDDEKGVFYLKGIGLNCLGTPTEDLELTAIKEQKVIGNVYENPRTINQKGEK